MAFITIAGQNQIAKKQGDNATLNISKFVLANVPDLGSEPATRIESIPNSSVVDQLNVTKSGYVNTNQVVYSLVMGSNVGDYQFNWVGLVDDEGVLIAVTYIPLTTKTKNNGGVPGNTFTRNFLISYAGIQQTTAINVPAETWQIDFSARLSGIDERESLSNLDIYGHEGFLGDGWKVTRQGSTNKYTVAAGIGYVGGIRAKNTTAQEITTSTYPNEIWLNVSLQGDISDMTAVSEFVIDTGPFADYVDGNGITHYLTKIATIESNGTVTDSRVFGSDSMRKHIDAVDPHEQYIKKGETGDGLGKSVSGIRGVITNEDFFVFRSPGIYKVQSPGGLPNQPPVGDGALFGMLEVNSEHGSEQRLSMTYTSLNGEIYTATSNAGRFGRWVDGSNKYFKKIFCDAAGVNQIELKSHVGFSVIRGFSDFDEFKFVASATNTESYVTISIDGIGPVSVKSVYSPSQIFKTAIVTVRYIDGAFYIAEQINPKTGNNVLDIGKLYTDTVDVLRPGEYALDGAEINSVNHPIACAIAAASSNYIAQADKDAEPIQYGGYYGFVDELDGSTTVTLPTVGGEFIRMFDDGRGVDDGRGFGGWEDATRIYNDYGDAMVPDVQTAVRGEDRSEYETAQSKQIANYTVFNDLRSYSFVQVRNITYYGKTRL